MTVTPYLFFNETGTTEISPLSLHDSLPICRLRRLPLQGLHAGDGEQGRVPAGADYELGRAAAARRRQDRKSTRLNSSHANISYAVFCLKKKRTDCSPHISALRRRSTVRCG